MAKQNEFKAVATVTDGQKEWNVTIYSHYGSMVEALTGASRFASNYIDSVLSVIDIHILVV